MSSNPNDTVKWWHKNVNDRNINLKIFEEVNRIDQESNDRHTRNVRSLRMYGVSDTLGKTPYSNATVMTPALPANRVTLNIIANMCDTVAARVSKMKPKITALTSKGDFSVQDQAKDLDHWLSGMFYKNDIYTLHQQMFRFATIFDIGALKHYIDWETGSIKTEPVLATELLIDPTDGLYNDPRTLYQVKYVDKDVLKAMYPEAKAHIEEAGPNLSTQRAGSGQQYHTKVPVVEAWHLSSGPNAEDGRHVISIGTRVLYSEEYSKECFPFTFFHWSPPILGFFGNSLAQRLTGNQLEINKMLRIIQKSFHLGAAFKVFLEYGSKVAKEHINNEIGSIVYYTGNKPEFYVPKTVHNEFFQHLQWLIDSSYQETGISRMSAQGAKPAGLESGKAMRTYQDIESERFALVAQRYENSFIHTAKVYMELAKELYDSEEKIDLEVVAESKKFVKSIKWSDVKVKGNELILQFFPTSSLPHHPAGRLAYIQELIDAGYITQDFGKSLLDFPDIEQYAKFDNAPIENLYMTLENLMKGKFVGPEPTQYLSVGIELFKKAYLYYKNENVSAEKLDLILRWIKLAENLESKRIAQQQPADPIMQGMPQEAGAPTPEQEAMAQQSGIPM